MIKTLIKSQQDDARDKKQRDLFDKKMKARQQMQEKMAREETLRFEHEGQVSKMEMEELELIKRLKNTQMKQQAAFQELENAL